MADVVIATPNSGNIKSQTTKISKVVQDNALEVAELKVHPELI